jgi:hypothetical protein
MNSPSRVSGRRRSRTASPAHRRVVLERKTSLSIARHSWSVGLWMVVMATGNGRRRGNAAAGGQDVYIYRVQRRRAAKYLPAVDVCVCVQGRAEIRGNQAQKRKISGVGNVPGPAGCPLFPAGGQIFCAPRVLFCGSGHDAASPEQNESELGRRIDRSSESSGRLPAVSCCAGDEAHCFFRGISNFINCRGRW